MRTLLCANNNLGAPHITLLCATKHHPLCVSTVLLIMWIGSGRPSIVIYGILLVLARQITLAFARCAIQPDVNGHVDIPSSWTSINEKAFYQCSNLKTVSIPHGVKRIEMAAFYKCATLKTVTLPDTITHIGNHSFQHSALETISIPSSVIDIGYAAFRSSIGLRSATIQVSSDPTVPANVKIGDFAFSRCSELTSVTIGDSITSIGIGAFQQCSNLASSTIGNSVKSIGDGAFQLCVRLTFVTIGDSVMSIGNYAFNQCSSLASVTIGDSVTSIGDFVVVYTLL